MKVCMVGMEKDFRSVPSGQGTQRYIYELVKNFTRINHPHISIYKQTLPELPSILSGFAPIMYGPLKDLSRYDIVHEFIGNIPRVRYGKAIVIDTMHDLHVLLPYMTALEEYKTARGFLGLKLFMIPGIERALKADYLLTNSTQTTKECIKFGFARDRIFMVHLGVDKRFVAKRLNDRGDHKKTFKVGYIGSFNSAKNLSFAIRAFKKTHDQNMRFELWGSKRGQYEQLADLSKNDKRIMFMGFAPEKSLVDIYDSFGVFVHPTLYEGFGLPILEAQARGLPVITWKKAQIPDEIRKYCLEVSDDNQMAQLIENIRDNGYNQKRRKAAMEYARSFTWEKTASKTLEAYKIIGEKEHLH